jgi:hypothetical protein
MLLSGRHSKSNNTLQRQKHKKSSLGTPLFPENDVIDSFEEIPGISGIGPGILFEEVFPFGL